MKIGEAILKIFHIHRYETVRESRVTVRYNSIFYKGDRSATEICRIDRCRCGKERAYLIDYTGDRTSVYVPYAKRALGII